MKERFIELQFYYFIKNLLSKFIYKIETLDIIEAYCNIGDIEIGTIKKLIKDIRNNQGPICTYTEEVCYVMRQAKVSYRDVTKITGISTTTQQRANDYIAQHLYQFENITGKLNKHEFEQVKKFMLVVSIIKSL